MLFFLYLFLHPLCRELRTFLHAPSRGAAPPYWSCIWCALLVAPLLRTKNAQSSPSVEHLFSFCCPPLASALTSEQFCPTCPGTTNTEHFSPVLGRRGVSFSPFPPFIFYEVIYFVFSFAIITLCLAPVQHSSDIPVGDQGYYTPSLSSPPCCGVGKLGV